MMNKFLDFARRGEPLLIKSVVASNSKGFIYVEAEREPHAKEALNGLRDVMQYSMKLVPIHEMTSVLTVQKLKKPVTAGMWVRFKRAGMYKGDLCKVVEVVDSGARVSRRLLFFSPSALCCDLCGCCRLLGHRETDSALGSGRAWRGRAAQVQEGPASAAKALQPGACQQPRRHATSLSCHRCE